MKAKILLSAYSCEPGCGSEPEAGWQWSVHLREGFEVTVITRPNNRPGIEAGLAELPGPHPKFIYYDPPALWVRLKKRGLPVPIFYMVWQMGMRWHLRRVLPRYDIVQHLTFNSFVQPGFLWSFKPLAILGPLGGGQVVPWRLLPLFRGAMLKEALRSLLIVSIRYSPLFWASCYFARLILTVNVETQRRVPHWLAGAKTARLVDGGVLPEEFPLIPTREKPVFELLWIGRLILFKAPVLAVRAFAAAYRQEPRLRLTFLGSGPEEAQVRKVAAELGVAEAVTLTGRLPKQEVPGVVASADALFFTSLHDTSGNAILEAMASGLPVVCLNHHGPGELTTDEIALRVEPGSVSQTVERLAEALVRLAALPLEARRQMGLKARERVEALYSWSAKAAVMTRFYQRVLGPRPALGALFNPRGVGEATERLHVLSRGGAPFLYLPQGAVQAARVALALYPAQSGKARLLRRAVYLALGLPLPSTKVAVDREAPFPQFLARVAGAAHPPRWGMLAGNPEAPGRRYLLILFDAAQRPCAIVKAGVEPEARRLVEAEAAALRALPETLAGAVRLRELWAGEEASALALPYLEGEAPAPGASPELERLLMDWLEHGAQAPLASLEAWRATGRQEDALVRAPVAHGDLAPWNIREHEGRWSVLDWERGTLRGVPGWDWFHYTLQPGVLVEKWGAERLAEEARAVLASPAFARYAAAAQIEGLERALLLGYLAYCTEVICQSEGAEALRGARVRLEHEG